MRVPALALLALTACFASYAQIVEETRLGLVGLRARELRRCLGAPTQIDAVGELEQQTYRIERWEESELSSSDPWDQRPGPGAIRPATRGDYPSFCQLDFELRAGVVETVRARGRDTQGMNADAACLLEARRCIPFEDE